MPRVLLELSSSSVQIGTMDQHKPEFTITTGFANQKDLAVWILWSFRSDTPAPCFFQPSFIFGLHRVFGRSILAGVLAVEGPQLDGCVRI